MLFMDDGCVMSCEFLSFRRYCSLGFKDRRLKLGDFGIAKGFAKGRNDVTHTSNNPGTKVFQIPFLK